MQEAATRETAETTDLEGGGGGGSNKRDGGGSRRWRLSGREWAGVEQVHGGDSRRWRWGGHSSGRELSGSSNMLFLGSGFLRLVSGVMTWSRH